jgi:hypothetical protein
MIKASMIKIQIPSPHPLPIGGEGKPACRRQGFGYWNLIDYGMYDIPMVKTQKWQNR